ncbi:hypothetical protein PA25_03630 [Pseudoalteromonas sp. A25]|uniref:type II secretion system protein GspK n=1 Tax=Pseudoalteromonas sp. A25 TaxID=116092 RepID=UPI00126136C3|nr:type II secretion system protein GspK [Pseudoalteromonas sp. A25]BBN80378.1 hypothetical protein PA25_03630 [Pseudoalteromonas sp. A25]
MKSNGIALVQILLFSAILTIVALYFSGSAKEQIAASQLATDRVEALVQLHSSRQALFFNLLTKQKSIVSSSQEPYQWNFFGEPFELAPGVQAQLYDLSSKINIRYPQRERLISLLVYAGMAEQEASVWVENLLEYQDIDTIDTYGRQEVSLSGSGNRNGPISNKNEIRGLGLEPDILDVLMPNITLFKISSFNPMNASSELLQALYGHDVASKVTQLRSVESTTKDSFKELTGIVEGDGIFIYPSNDTQVVISSSYGQVNLKHDWIVSFNPYASGQSLPYIPLYIKE